MEFCGWIALWYMCVSEPVGINQYIVEWSVLANIINNHKEYKYLPINKNIFSLFFVVKKKN